MKKLTTAAALACMLGVFSAEGALIINGDFETGNLASWGNIPITGVTSAEAHSGTYSAVLGPLIGGIGQSVSVVPGTTYRLSFWAKDDGDSLLGQIFSVHFGQISLVPLDLDGVIPDAVFNPTTTWTQYTYLFTADESTATVAFGWAGGRRSAFIDDVTLTAVPEPSTILAGALLLLPLGLSILRSRKRRAA